MCPKIPLCTIQNFLSVALEGFLDHYHNEGNIYNLFRASQNYSGTTRDAGPQTSIYEEHLRIHQANKRGLLDLLMNDSAARTLRWFFETLTLMSLKQEFHRAREEDLQYFIAYFLC